MGLDVYPPHQTIPGRSCVSNSYIRVTKLSFPTCNPTKARAALRSLGVTVVSQLDADGPATT